MRKRIYISGPLTSSGNVNENLERAMGAARALIDAGFAPFCPHLMCRVDPAEEYPHATWMEVELPWVSVADAVLRLPGESVGADLEADHARKLGVPVFRSIVDLADHFAVHAAAHVASDARSFPGYQNTKQAVGTHRIDAQAASFG